MTKVISALLIGLGLGAASVWFYLHTAAPAQAATPEPEKESPLHFTSEQRRKAGLILEVPKEVEISPEFHVSGRVIDPTALITSFAEVSGARVALAVSEKALVRVKTLYEADTNASQENVETAEAAVAQAKLQLASAQGRLVAAWGTAIAEQVNGGLINELLEKGGSLARIDFPVGNPSAEFSSPVRVSELAGNSREIDAAMLGPVAIADPQVSGHGYFILIRDRRIAIGTVLNATVTTTAPPIKALTVPKDAVVFHEGSAWIYVLGYKDTFERRLVELGSSVMKTYAINGTIAPDDQVVVFGAQQLLSGELQAGAEPD